MAYHDFNGCVKLPDGNSWTSLPFEVSSNVMIRYDDMVWSDKGKSMMMLVFFKSGCISII